MDIMGGGSTTASPSCSSYQPSPGASYNPSPASSSFPSPTNSSYANVVVNAADGNSLIPWLKNLSSASSASASSSAKFHHLYRGGGSISAPVTPPLSSPTARTPRIKTDWDESSSSAFWGGSHHSFLPLSTPPSPGRAIIPDSEWFAAGSGGPTSPTFSLVSSNPFGFKFGTLARSGSNMCTPGQSGTCSPAVPDHTGDVPMAELISDDFAFGSIKGGLVKPWEGETIHEDSGLDDLELTLGSSRTRFVVLLSSPVLLLLNKLMTLVHFFLSYCF